MEAARIAVGPRLSSSDPASASSADEFLVELRLNEEFNRILAKETGKAPADLAKLDDAAYREQASTEKQRSEGELAYHRTVVLTYFHNVPPFSSQMKKMGKSSKGILQKMKKGIGRKLTGKSRKTKPVEFDNPFMGQVGLS